jgi:transcription initiation factor TFIIB
MAYTQPFPLVQQLQQQKVELPQFGPDLAVRLICPECRDPNPSIREEFSSGDLVCGSCGLVLGDRIVDTRSEWRVSLDMHFYFIHHTFYHRALVDLRK